MLPFPVERQLGGLPVGAGREFVCRYLRRGRRMAQYFWRRYRVRNLLLGLRGPQYGTSHGTPFGPAAHVQVEVR